MFTFLLVCAVVNCVCVCVANLANVRNNKPSSSSLNGAKQMARNELQPLFDPCPISQTS